MVEPTELIQVPNQIYNNWICPVDEVAIIVCLPYVRVFASAVVKAGIVAILDGNVWANDDDDENDVVNESWQGLRESSSR